MGYNVDFWTLPDHKGPKQTAVVHDSVRPWPCKASESEIARDDPTSIRATRFSERQQSKEGHTSRRARMRRSWGFWTIPGDRAGLKPDSGTQSCSKGDREFHGYILSCWSAWMGLKLRFWLHWRVQREPRPSQVLQNRLQNHTSSLESEDPLDGCSVVPPLTQI